MGMGAWLKAKMSLDSSGVSVGAKNADKEVTSLFSKISRGSKAAFAGFTKVALASFGAVAVGATGLYKTVKKSFNFETAQLQFKAVLGSMKKAKDRFAELKDFSARTPFQLPGILQASRLMSVFSEGVLGAGKDLEFIGDAAAVADRGIEEVAFWVSRAYSLIQNGQPFGEAALRLQEMGVMSARARQEIDRLQKSGASSSDVWMTLKRDLERFKGAMGEMATTGNGLISTMKDNWTIGVATFGEEFKDLAKGGLKLAIDKIQELVKDGTIQKWAANAKEALSAVVETIRLISHGGEQRSEVLQALGGVVRAAFDAAAMSAVQILTKAVPRIGYALGEAIKDGATGAMQKGFDRNTAIRQLQQRGELESEAGTGGLLGNKKEREAIRERNDARIEKFMKEMASASFEEQGEALSKQFGAGSDLQDAVEKFKNVLNRDGDRLVDNLEKGGKKLTDSLEGGGRKLETQVGDAANNIGDSGTEFRDTVTGAGQDLAGGKSGRKTKDLGTVYTGGMGKSIEQAKDFLHVGTDDLESQLEFWQKKLAGTQRRGADTTAALGWNASFHTARAGERREFNQAAMADVIKRIEGLIVLQSQPQKELTALEKESIEQTRLLRDINNRQYFSTL